MIDEDAAQMCESCTIEAENGTKGAEALAAAGHFGRARSIDLLAYETAIQAIAYHWVFRGWATLEREKCREQLFISEDALGNHPLKQLLIAFIDPTIRAFAKDVANHIGRGEPPGIAPDSAVRAMVLEAGAPPLPLSEFNRMKNFGLYPVRKGQAIHTPSEVPKEEYEEIHARVTTRIKVVKALIRTPLSEASIADVGRNCRKLAAEGFSIDWSFLLKVRQVEKATGRSFAEIVEHLVAKQGGFHGSKDSSSADRQSQVSNRVGSGIATGFPTHQLPSTSPRVLVRGMPPPRCSRGHPPSPEPPLGGGAWGLCQGSPRTSG